MPMTRQLIMVAEVAHRECIETVDLSGLDTQMDHNAMLELQRDQQQLLNLIHEVRQQGICNHVPMPQLIICGAQSAGKSSVLEAISRFRFPIRETGCTRWATELILKRAESHVVHVSVIQADPECATSGALKAFTKRATTCTDMDHLAKLLAEEQAVLHLAHRDSDHGFIIEDTLRIEVCGPNLPHLTLVDLPGITHEGDSEDVNAAKRIATKYLGNESAIILPVLETHQYTSNQRVLDFVNQYDKERKRTFAILTKPDRVEPGSDLESVAVELAKNRHSKYGGFEYGWVVLKNRDQSTLNTTDVERDACEREFFRKGIWSGADPNLWGVRSLRCRLSAILFKRIGNVLPQLTKGVETRINDISLQIRKFGPERATPEQQRKYLVDTVTKFRELIICGKKGDFSDPFFSTQRQGIKTTLRANIHDRNGQYSNEMAVQKPERGTVLALFKNGRTAEALDAVSQTASKYRGQSLPGFQNSELLGILFREEVKGNWRDVTLKHAEATFNYVKGFLYAALQAATDERTAHLIMQEILSDVLETRHHELQEMCSLLLKPHEAGHPITYDPDYEKQCRVLADELGGGDARGSPEEAPEKHYANFILSGLATYHKIKLRILVDNVAVLAIESCLLHQLEDTLPLATVAAMDNDTLGRLAGEDEDIGEARRSASNSLVALKAAQALLKRMISAEKLKDQGRFYFRSR
ncbi:hypothetical protein P152DRAFT_49023 [Eremomyces bilateralis CBS 781.70]|uniref:P-loop containing nucleoside triphosphate hydrolase protein n=1 Tax=Eremomyces bilateralis CBS 781.70 TaxID=1392243 RepID=A0A6G1G198_9PEZI|nr:uncharacterized protein P152DRAFT_49023 [Eremomyces bilateralis CBS 781.70]KAF1811706.1 hypothetical protein P152DRAFT_49023 [Eremomyces bilateralis CBS 781.70]